MIHWSIELDDVFSVPAVNDCLRSRCRSTNLTRRSVSTKRHKATGRSQYRKRDVSPGHMRSPAAQPRAFYFCRHGAKTIWHIDWFPEKLALARCKFSNVASTEHDSKGSAAGGMMPIAAPRLRLLTNHIRVCLPCGISSEGGPEHDRKRDCSMPLSAVLKSAVGCCAQAANATTIVIPLARRTGLTLAARQCGT